MPWGDHRAAREGDIRARRAGAKEAARAIMRATHRSSRPTGDAAARESHPDRHSARLAARRLSAFVGEGEPGASDGQTAQAVMAALAQARADRGHDDRTAPPGDTARLNHKLVDELGQTYDDELEQIHNRDADPDDEHGDDDFDQWLADNGVDPEDLDAVLAELHDDAHDELLDLLEQAYGADLEGQYEQSDERDDGAPRRRRGHQRRRWRRARVAASP